MKYIIFSFLIFICFSSTTYAEVDERKTDIYFGNGVWNDSDQAKSGRDRLNGAIKRNIIKNNPFLQEKYGAVKLQYNWSQGKMTDVLETFYQLKNAGQLNNVSFYTTLTLLIGGGWSNTMSTSAAASLIARIPFVAISEELNVEKMIHKYYDESFGHSHRVLLVSHSQGNMFANRVYDALIPNGYKDYFANVQVGSPAKSVHSNIGMYVTNIGDLIINPLPGSMSGNAKPDPINRLGPVLSDCLTTLRNGDFDDVPSECGKMINHEFIPAYLGQLDPFKKIVADINTSLHTLENIPSQWRKSKDVGCPNTCDQHILVEHRFDSSLDKNMSKVTVLSFDDTAKLYKVNGTYVKGDAAGTAINNILDGTVCYELNGTSPLQKTFGIDTGTKHNGALEITLSWEKITSDYNLTIGDNAVGEKLGGEIDVQTCNLEHYYVQDEYTIHTGTYLVDILTVNTPDASPLDVLELSIKVPNYSKPGLSEPQGPRTKTMKFLHDDANGSVARITIKKQEENRFLYFDKTMQSSSKGINGTSYFDSSRCQPGVVDNGCGCINCSYQLFNLLKKANLGPLSGAKVSMFHVKSYPSGEPLYTGSTVESDDLFDAGVFRFTGELIDSLDDDAWYVIEVQGGTDIDADDNMEVDVVATQNTGTVRALVPGYAFKTGHPKVNILTEIAYQIVAESLEGEETDISTIVSTLDDVAQRLLRTKVYPQQDGGLSYTDLLDWLPQLDQNLTVADYGLYIKPIVKKVLLDESIYTDAYNVVYHPEGTVPLLRMTLLNVDENTTVGTAIGTIRVLSEGNGGIRSFELSGEGAGMFSVDSNGNVSVKYPLDYETRESYTLFAKAANGSGDSAGTLLKIAVNDIADAPKITVPDKKPRIFDTATAGTAVTGLEIDPGSTPLIAVDVDGNDSEWFTVDLDGTLKISKPLKSAVEKSSYELYITAFNESEMSETATLTVEAVPESVDPALLACIDSKLGLQSGTTPTAEQLQSVASLFCGSSYAITDISWIRHLPNLRKLVFFDNNISDVSPLAALTSLEELDISNNPVSDIAPLANLKQLTYLGLDTLPVENISAVGSLTSLMSLRLGDLPAKIDTPLNHLPNMSYLYLIDMNISDLKIVQNMPNLTFLYAYHNHLKSLEGIEELSNLEYLGVAENGIENIESIGSLTNLLEFDAEQNSISDISPLTHLSELRYIDLRNNNLSNIEALSGATNLTNLDLRENRITNISYLQDLNKLRVVRLEANCITDFSPVDHVPHVYGKSDQEVCEP